MGCNGSKDDKLPQLLLPQQRTVEQQRKDIADRDETRAKYEWKYDEPQPLPPKLAKVPASEIPLQNMKDFILIFARINISKVLEWTNLLDHWVKEHKTAGPWDKFHAIFEPLSLYPPPSIAKDWQTDDAFCRSRTNGLYPWFLTKADLKAHDFPVTDALLGDLIKGHTLESLGNEGRLFTCSFPQLVGVTPREGAVIAAPIELHWVNDDGFLRPLAIQLGQKSTDSPIFTPNDPPNLWLAVKMHANAAITICHTYNIHAVEMHWVSETIWLALIRNLAADHPLRVFFAPHYRVLFFVNEQFRMQFNDSAVASFIYMETSAPKGHWELMSNGYKGWTFDRLNIVKQYEKRGLHHLKKETYYRDDSTTIWHTHNKLCRGLVESVYKTDKDVQEDFQLQAWLEELASPIGGNMQGLPVDANGKMSTREQLIEMTTCMFFDVTHKHSFLEAAKLDYFGFAPYNPDTFKLPIPQTKDEISIETIVEALPPNKEAVLAGALMHNGGTAPPDFKLTNLPKGYLAGAPEGVEKAVETWKEDLNKVEDQMQKRNKEAGVNYTYCLPSISANQIHN